MQISTLVVASIVGLITPFVVAFAAKQHDRTIQTVLAFIVAGLGSVLAYATTHSGSADLGQLWLVFVGTGGVAGSSTKWITGDLVGKVNRFTGESKLTLGRTKEQLLGGVATKPVAGKSPLPG